MSDTAPSRIEPLNEMEPLLSTNEVALMARVSKMTVYRLIHDGRLPAVQVGGSFRIPVSAARALCQTGKPAHDEGPESA